MVIFGLFFRGRVGFVRGVGVLLGVGYVTRPIKLYGTDGFKSKIWDILREHGYKAYRELAIVVNNISQLKMTNLANLYL